MAGLAVWFLAYLYPTIGYGVMGFMPWNLLIIAVVWGLIEMIIAGIIGARLYTEPVGIPSRA